MLKRGKFSRVASNTIDCALMSEEGSGFLSQAFERLHVKLKTMVEGRLSRGKKGQDVASSSQAEVLRIHAKLQRKEPRNLQGPKRIR